jgi:formamidopyrimidine-DNA glycosylase
MHLFLPDEVLQAPPLNKLGLEPLEEGFTLEMFRRALGKRPTKIKPLLLNQEVVVGLGNIYVDEALHMAGIHPETEANKLKRKEQELLHFAIVKTLSAAVEAGGSSIKSYVNGQGEMGLFQHSLKAYGRTGEPCLTCGSPIEKSVVGGRGTHTCPKCQKQPRGLTIPKSGSNSSQRNNTVKRRLDGTDQ